MSKPRERDVLVNLRTTQQVKDNLIELTKLMGEEAGTRLTQTQVFEMLVADALRARVVQEDA